MMVPDHMRLQSPVESYNVLLGNVLAQGDEASPRDSLTKELCGLYVSFDDPTDNMIVGEEHEDFIESEIRTVMAGEPPEQKAPDELIERLDLEEDGTFFEQGIRDAISSNWDTWVSRFHEDRDTRKNCATFTRPTDRDPPCTIAIQFVVRNNDVHLHTFNRSQDLMFAYPMDCALFGTLIEHMANDLDGLVKDEITVGRWSHLMGSAHIYAEQFEEAKSIAWADD